MCSGHVIWNHLLFCTIPYLGVEVFSFRLVMVWPLSLCIVIQLLSICIYVYNMNYNHVQQKNIPLRNIHIFRAFKPSRNKLWISNYYFFFQWIYNASQRLLLKPFKCGILANLWASHVHTSILILYRTPESQVWDFCLFSFKTQYINLYTPDTHDWTTRNYTEILSIVSMMNLQFSPKLSHYYYAKEWFYAVHFTQSLRTPRILFQRLERTRVACHY